MTMAMGLKTMTALLAQPVGRSARRRVSYGLAVFAAALALSGCGVVSLAGSAAGAAVSVAGSVISTGVEVTGKVAGAAIDAVRPAKPVP